MRKLFAVSALACVALSCFVASAGANPAPTKLSIQAYPGGVSGYVGSPQAKACSSDRKVVVYQQVGDVRDPGSDPRIASDLAEPSEARFMWTVETGKTGLFYASVAATPGCAPELSGVIESQTPAFELQSMNASYPPCGPYVSEGTSEICWFGQLYMSLEEDGPFDACRFGPGSGSCPGIGKETFFPWGANLYGGRNGDPHTRVYWKPDGSVRSLTLVSFWGNSAGGDGAGHLGGHIPNSSSDRYSIDDAYAQNDAGYPNGDHFYTPDLPGQAPGEVGGPMKLNFSNGSGIDVGAQLWVSGYLYLKH